MNALKSGIISLSGTILQQFLTLVGIIVLGRLLTPEDFGTYAITWAIFLFFQAFLDFGITPIYIKIAKVDKYINSSFFAVNVLLGCGVSLILLLLSPVVSWYYDNPMLGSLLAVQAIVPIVQSMSNQPFGQLQRRQRFWHTETITSVSTLMSIIVGIICALWAMGPWALLFKQLSYNATRLTGALYASGARYIWTGKRGILSIKKYLYEASNLTWSRLATGISGNLEKLFIGKISGESLLGHYNQALFVSDKPLVFTHGLTTPALSYLAHLPRNRIAEAYQVLILTILSLIGLPCLLIYFYGNEIVLLLLGDQWTQAGHYVVHLSFLGIALIIKALCGVIMVNEWRSKQILRYNIIYMILIYPPALFLIWWQNDLILFVRVFSMLSLVYWFVTLFFALHSYVVELKNELITLSLYIIVLFATFFACTYFLNPLLTFLHWIPAMVIIYLIAWLLSQCIVYILFRNLFMSQYHFVAERLK